MHIFSQNSFLVLFVHRSSRSIVLVNQALKEYVMVLLLRYSLDASEEPDSRLCAKFEGLSVLRRFRSSNHSGLSYRYVIPIWMLKRERPSICGRIRYTQGTLELLSNRILKKQNLQLCSLS